MPSIHNHKHLATHTHDRLTMTTKKKIELCNKFLRQIKEGYRQGLPIASWGSQRASAIRLTLANYYRLEVARQSPNNSVCLVSLISSGHQGDTIAHYNRHDVGALSWRCQFHKRRVTKVFTDVSNEVTKEPQSFLQRCGEG